MTRNRKMPDHWYATRSSQPRWSQDWQHQRNAVNPLRVGHSTSHRQTTPQQVTTKPAPPSPQQPQEPRRRFTFGWTFWVTMTILVSGGIGFSSVALLLKLPAVPNCPSIFWPTASASVRIYCGQLAANKRTTKDLLEAIALIDALPKDHPLRPEINRHIEEWSVEILAIGEEKFQAGQLEEAIEIANRIPRDVPAFTLVKEQIKEWETLWEKASGIYEQAEEHLRQSNWTLAFREAVKLTTIDNQYWAAVKYTQLVDLIQIGRDDSQKLDQAYRLSKSGRVDDILKAIQAAEKITPKSFAYKEAQDLIAESGNKLLKLATSRLEQRNWQGVLEIANKLPASVKLPDVKADLIDLANAISTAESGSSGDLEIAIASVQKLGTDRPLYDEGQELIDRWQRELEDVARLERARAFASSGLVSDLQIAIAEAQLIPSPNPRYQEARAEISQWTRQIQTLEDQPYLDRATQLASFGGVQSLQEAIQEARQIAPNRALYSEAQSNIKDWTRTVQRLEDQPYLDRATQLANLGRAESLKQAIQEARRIAPNRALYPEAQSKIKDWTRTVQRLEDQPYLDQARTLANSGNLSAAIAAAEQIKSGRVLYGEAQNLIKGWKTEVLGQQRLQQAYQSGTLGTPNAIVEAIRLARQVPSSAKVRGDAVSAVNRWSYQLLALAQDRAAFSLTQAIQLAKMIPSGTEAYNAAQASIQEWQRILEPPPPLVVVPPGNDAQPSLEPPEHELPLDN
ncbi:chromosome segregation ATPase [Coleofasciculus chthonoplastes]|uniref:chromosome segregation ATPase n=1 Tax=Coleofasciculus chthonoplastes TaxID=64178 RepID=UPI0032FBBC4F